MIYGPRAGPRANKYYEQRREKERRIRKNYDSPRGIVALVVNRSDERFGQIGLVDSDPELLFLTRVKYADKTFSLYLENGGDIELFQIGDDEDCEEINFSEITFSETSQAKEVRRLLSNDRDQRVELINRGYELGLDSKNLAKQYFQLFKRRIDHL